MGKITINFNIPISLMITSSHSPLGISSKELNQILNSVPGETTIIKIDETSSQGHLCRTWRVEGENSNFLDGTEIVAKYKITAGAPSVPGAFNPLHIFDGVDIVGPVVITQPIVSGTYTYTITGINGSAQSTTPKPAIQLDPNSTGVHLYGKAKCTCGADKCGGTHSNWCDKYDPIV